MESKFLSRIHAIASEYSQLCVGIDPSDEMLAMWDLPSSIVGLREFSLHVVRTCSTRVGFIKPQIAFYERFGSAGFQILEETIGEARSLGLFVVADAKRGDIGSSMSGYTEAWFSPDSSLRSDALTVNSYLGVSTMHEISTYSENFDAGIFVLCATSNPEASEIQSSRQGDRLLPKIVFDAAIASPVKNIGLVIGATNALADVGLAEIYQRDTQLPILAPGFGSQGAKLGELQAIYGASSKNVIACVSRSVLRSGKQELANAINSAKLEL